jgi:hypothetical protein
MAGYVARIASRYRCTLASQGFPSTLDLAARNGHNVPMITKALKDFLKMESASGILLILATIVALILANSILADYYKALLAIPVHIRVGNLEIAKPLLLWINDGLMAVFFSFNSSPLHRKADTLYVICDKVRYYCARKVWDEEIGNRCHGL